VAFRIAEHFHVAAPVDVVWAYLIDPRRVVQCLPGAELTDARDDHTFAGKVKIKVGPVVASYSGTATLTEVNEADHLVRITAEGKEGGGTGSARMRMTSHVSAADAGGSDVQVEAELDVAGKIVQFGRGMIETVNQQLFSQFTACVRQTLETGDAAAAASTAPEASALPAASSPASAPALPHTAQPVRVLPLLLSALWSSLLRLFRRKS
jgi:carbon monoxide dehydrogenase subunit G